MEGMDESTATRIAQRDALEARLRDMHNEALRRLRSYAGTLDAERAEGLRRIVDFAESTGNYYTALYTLQSIEVDMRDFREEFKQLIRRFEIKDDDARLNTYDRQKGRPPKANTKINSDD